MTIIITYWCIGVMQSDDLLGAACQSRQLQAGFTLIICIFINAPLLSDACTVNGNLITRLTAGSLAEAEPRSRPAAPEAGQAQ